MEDDLPLNFSLEPQDYIARSINATTLVRQDNLLINGHWKLNLNQCRVFFVALSMIEFDDEDFRPYKIRGKDLNKILELSGNSLYQQLSSDVPKLLSATIGIKNAKDESFAYMNVFSTATFTDGNLFMKFNSDMKPYLLNLKKKFTVFKLEDSLKFKSTYTIRLFLLLKQFDSTGWRQIDLTELRTHMNLDAKTDKSLKSDLYTKVSDLKKRILEPAIKELNKNGFAVSYTEIKDSRKIVGFKFTWKDQVNLPERVKLNPVDASAANAVRRLQALKLQDRQISYIGVLIKKNIITRQELNQTLWHIETSIREKNIEENKKGGYAYKTFQKKFNLGEF